jgi:RNA polymerase sigma factor (TIGR02999 family)
MAVPAGGDSVPATREPITQLLTAWSGGDGGALERLIPLVYTELRQLAARHVRREGPANTLVPTALVHEAFLRLVDIEHADLRGRGHFFQLASRLMRQILVDQARSRRAAKRGGGQVELKLDELADGAAAARASAGAGELAGTAQPEPPRLVDIAAVDAALVRLEALDQQQAQIVELRFFGGLTIDETALALDLSSATVKRHWMIAKAWLSRELSHEAGP